MKICMIIDSLAAAGAERVVVTLSETLYNQSHHVDIILFEDCIEYDINPNIPIHILKKHNTHSLKKLIESLEKSNNGKYDYIYSHLHNKIKILQRLKRDDIYYVFHIPVSNRFNKKNRVEGYIKKKKLQLRYRNKHFIAVSKGIEKDLIEHNFTAKSITAIYNPFNFSSIIEQSNRNDMDIPKEDYIINVARFHIQKRHDILIKAFAKSKLPCKLLLVGKGSDEETNKIKSLIRELQLEKQVILVGFKANPFPLIKNAKLFVLSSDFEGLPTVIIESLILNTPVVSTNCPSGPSEIMINNLSDYLVPVGDIDALAKKMHNAFFNPPHINQSDLERFCAENIAKEYLAIKDIHAKAIE